MLSYIGRKIFFGIATLLIGVFAVLPLFIFAIITFWTAVTFLVFLVLFKGIGASWSRFSQWWSDEPLESPEVVAQRQRTLAAVKRSLRHEAGSGSQSSNTTTRSHSNRSNSNVSLASLPQPNRDYEGILASASHQRPVVDSLLTSYKGVGGWLVRNDSTTTTNNYNYNYNSNTDTDFAVDNQAIYMALQRRQGQGQSQSQAQVQPDATPPSFRRRSFGAASSGINSPEMIQTPSAQGRNASGSHHRRQMSGTVSPQSYFSVAAAARSTTSFNSRRNSRVLAKETVRVGTDSDDDDEGSGGENAVS